MNIKQDLSPNFTPASQSQAQYGQPRTFREIAIHWWGDPATKPTLQGVVNVLKTPSRKASAHYVVSDKQIVQLVKEEDVSWATGSANPITISIEVDPQVPGETYKTLGWLVGDIRKRRGNMPLVPHKKYMNTQCPGTIDLLRIDREASTLPEPNPGYAPTHEGMTVEKDGYIYKSYKKDGKLLWTKEPKVQPPVEKPITEETIIPQIESRAVKDIKKELEDLRADNKKKNNEIGKLLVESQGYQIRLERAKDFVKSV